MRKAKLFIINTIILTLTSIIIQSISIFFNVYISNKIGAEGVGLFTLIISVFSFFITLATSGINLTVTRIVSEETAKGNIKGAKKAIFECLILSFCFGILASTILLLTSDFIVNICFKNKITKLPLYIISISLPFISMSAAINGYFSATRKVFKTAISQIISQIITILLANIFLNMLLPRGLDYACISLILATCLSEIISFFDLYIIYKFDKRKNKIEKDKKSYQKNIFHICLPIAITSYIRSGLNTLKQLLIPMRLQTHGLSHSASLAKYGTVTGMVMPILAFPGVFVNTLASLLIPEFSSIFVTKNYNRIKFLTNKIFKLSFTMSACIFGIFISFGDELLIMIYHNAEASKYLLTLAPLVLIMYVDNIVDGMLRGLDEQVNVMKCNILDLFMSITFIYFFIPIFSLKAYLASIYLSEILNGSISIYLLLRKTKIKFNIIDWILKPVGVALISRYLLYIFYSIFNLHAIIPKIIIYIIIFIFTLFVTKTITLKDIKI